jgi:hypothetical protein
VLYTYSGFLELALEPAGGDKGSSWKNTQGDRKFGCYRYKKH